MRAFLAFVALLAPMTGFAQQISWTPPIAVIAPEDVSLTLQVAGETHYGFQRAWVSLGRATPAGAEVSSTQVALQRERMVGFLIVRDGLGQTSFDETTAQAKLRTFQYWRDQFVAPRRAGLFMQGEAAVRWILFPHADAAGTAHECAGFVANGKAMRLELSGYWCVAGGKPATEADVQAFVGAIGYKDILVPTPTATPPGR